jgi:arylsulfate sulfotransferase
MWQLVKPLCTRAAARRTSVRRPGRHRPYCTPLEGRCLLSVALTETAPAVPYVGSPVIWTAMSRGLGKQQVYQFSIALEGGPFQVVSDFSSSPSFTWNPMQQGTYQILVDVKSGLTARKSESTIATYTAQSRVVGNTAVVTPMANPLVALFSAPPSPGTSMYVQFAQQGPNPSWQDTSPLAIVPGESTNFIVAGMLPDTTYLMRYVLDDGTVSAPLAFTTGSLPANLIFPTFTVVQPPAPGTDLSQGVIFHGGANTANSFNRVNTLATDLNGNVIWYYDRMANNFPGHALNLEPGGTVMMLGGKDVGVAGAGYNTLRQVDLAGDTLRETNINAVNAELAALHQPRIIDFDHEAKLLPNGDTAVVASTPEIADYKGTPTRFVGDLVIVLNQNFQVNWVWNSFRWLSTNRLGPDHGVPSDWLHANSVSWSPEDDDLIVSLRAQDWIIKIDYADGTGNGHTIWTLGKGGDFTAIAPPNTPQPWFSHQHDARMINDNTLLVFDDGNTREEFDPSAQSRGQEWILNEQNMTATLVVNAEMGNYSSFLGSSELLSNGDLAFTSGGLVLDRHTAGQSIEVLPDGTIIYVLQMSGSEYRSYFESTLYSADLLD